MLTKTKEKLLKAADYYTVSPEIYDTEDIVNIIEDRVKRIRSLDTAYAELKKLTANYLEKEASRLEKKTKKRREEDSDLELISKIKKHL